MLVFAASIKAHTPPDLTELQTNGLRQILITETEVEDILKILDTSKATGPDCINPRLLREAGQSILI
jgi:hypothetical protein